MVAAADMEAATAVKSVVATVVVADVIATTALTAEARATEVVDNQDTATEEEARTAEAMVLRLLRPTVAAPSLLPQQHPPPLLNLPPQR